MWGVVLWSARSETFSREGFSLFQLDTKKNSKRTHNTTRTQGVVKNTRRGLSPLCKRKPSATTQHVVQSVKDEDVHAKSYYGVLSKDIEKNQIQKKDLLYNMFRVCKRGSLLLLLFFVRQ